MYQRWGAAATAVGVAAAVAGSPAAARAGVVFEWVSGEVNYTCLPNGSASVDLYLRETLTNGSPSLLAQADGLYSGVARVTRTAAPTSPAFLTAAARDAANFDARRPLDDTYGDYSSNSDQIVASRGTVANAGGFRDIDDPNGTPVIVDSPTIRRVSVGRVNVQTGLIPLQRTRFSIGDAPGGGGTVTWGTNQLLDQRILPTSIDVCVLGSYAGSYPPAWTGAVSSAWGDGRNWSDGRTPTAASHAMFPAGTRFVTLASGSAAGLIVAVSQSNTTLTGGTLGATDVRIAPGSTVTIQSDVVASGRGLFVTTDPFIASYPLSGSGTLVLAGASNTYNGLIATNGTIVSTTAPGQLGVGPISVESGAAVVANAVRGNPVSVSGFARVAIRPRSAGGLTSAVASLAIAGSGDAWAGTVDLADTAVAIDYTNTSPLATVRDQVKSAYAGGAWTGTGLSSTLAAGTGNALGFAEASTILGPAGGTFRGVAVDSTTVLVRYTRAGDANLDGVVNGSDFSLLAGSYGKTGRFWYDGDFNYDGTVNGADFSLLAGNYGSALPGLQANLTAEDWAALRAFGSTVPEPAAFSLLGAAGLGLLARRRCRR